MMQGQQDRLSGSCSGISLTPKLKEFMIMRHVQALDTNKVRHGSLGIAPRRLRRIGRLVAGNSGKRRLVTVPALEQERLDLQGKHTERPNPNSKTQTCCLWHLSSRKLDSCAHDPIVRCGCTSTRHPGLKLSSTALATRQPSSQLRSQLVMG